MGCVCGAGVAVCGACGVFYKEAAVGWLNDNIEPSRIDPAYVRVSPSTGNRKEDFWLHN